MITRFPTTMFHSGRLRFGAVGLFAAVILAATGYGYSAAAFQDRGSPVGVEIDVKPGAFPNRINLGARGALPVAILSSRTFDAARVNPATVTLAGSPIVKQKKEQLRASLKDVNGDGMADLLVYVSIPFLKLNSGDGQAALKALTFDGTPVEGSDSVVARGASIIATGAGGSAQGVVIQGAGNCNPAAVTIPAQGTATPYPSTIDVSGLSGNITKLTVSLNQLSHSFPNDLDILLVGPGGQKVILMSDAGGDENFPIVNVDLTFDDAAAQQLPDETQITSGTYKPTDFQTGDVFPAPAPAGPYGTALSAFNGLSPNGTYSLYVLDDFSGDGGSLAGGWCLNIITDTMPGCSLTCPANITVSNTANQCGAVVNYPAPTTSGECGTVACSPASGSFFPVGTTTVTCTDQGTVGTAPTGITAPSCSFSVTVNDTQAPSITCPANVGNPGPGPVAVQFPSPTASDNCPGVTTSCNPPSGSAFASGVTTVTCTATDASGNSASCGFTVTVGQGGFDVCLQDDSDPSRVLLFSTTTGQYLFCCGARSFSGTGSVIVKGNNVTLSHVAPDRRVTARVDLSSARGSASIQNEAGKTICTITDRNTTNNTCACGGNVPAS
ncbi:MAG TPA: HYR domain-containing protein [Blastocatellia bacterium]|nr:HYR domain-containing protein [Blastocatellia bacterium]